MADGKLFIACGASRSGKTAWVKEQIKNQTRVMVWDVEGAYTIGKRISNKNDLYKWLVSGSGSVCYTGALSDFDYFCQVAFCWARKIYLKAKPSVLVVEELADVTSPAKAPPGWGIVVRRGLKYDLTIYAITQRPSESDKTCFGNASMIHCCRLSTATDCRYMADQLGIPVAEIQGMRSDSEANRWDFLQRNQENGKISRGFLSFGPSGKAIFKQKK
jgi:hypothetical protein